MDSNITFQVIMYLVCDGLSFPTSRHHHSHQHHTTDSSPSTSDSAAPPQDYYGPDMNGGPPEDTDYRPAPPYSPSPPPPPPLPPIQKVASPKDSKPIKKVHWIDRTEKRFFHNITNAQLELKKEIRNTNLRIEAVHKNVKNVKSHLFGIEMFGSIFLAAKMLIPVIRNLISGGSATAQGMNIPHPLHHAFCMDPVCIMKPGDYCVDNKTCQVLYCSTMWYSWAKITRFECRGISDYLYENFYNECQLKNCAT